LEKLQTFLVKKYLLLIINELSGYSILLYFKFKKKHQPVTSIPLPKPEMYVLEFVILDDVESV